jgi:hypothetical protein
MLVYPDNPTFISTSRFLVGRTVSRKTKSETEKGNQPDMINIKIP